MRALAVALSVVSALASACDSKPPAAARGSLGGELAARVGGEEVAVETVRRIADAQAVPPETALDFALRDAIFAAEARERAPSWKRDKAEARVLGRLLLASLLDEAKRRGPPTDAEVEDKTTKYWTRVARPAAAVVGNAVVLVPAGSTEETWAKAERVASRIAAEMAKVAKPLGEAQATYDFEQAVLYEPTGSLGEVLKQAKEVDGEGLKIVAESSPPFAADSLTVTKVKQERQSFDETFVAKASQARPGEVLAPFRTSFGVHVVVGVAQIPAEELDLEARRARFADEIYSDRTRTLTNELLASLREQHRVEIDRAADAAVAEIRVEP